MSKKTIEIVNTEAVAAIAATLKEHFEKHPNATIRKFAHATEMNYMGLLNASRKPVVGEAYDPEAKNYTAMAELIVKNGKDVAGVNWEELETVNRASTATLIKDMDKFTVGSKVYIRRNPTTPYEIVYKTATHIVLLLEGSTEPIAWQHSTFLFNGPQFEPRKAVEVEAEAEVEAEVAE